MLRKILERPERCRSSDFNLKKGGNVDGSNDEGRVECEGGRSGCIDCIDIVEGQEEEEEEEGSFNGREEVEEEEEEGFFNGREKEEEEGSAGFLRNSLKLTHIIKFNNSGKNDAPFSNRNLHDECPVSDDDDDVF
jgi:hypothetical protein